MNTIIDLANTIFKPLIDLGAAPLMTIVLTLIALCFKVKPTRALEGGLKLGIALTGISAIIGILTTAFSDAMASFVERTGISLNITDVGWAPLATITWGSPYTLYFLLIMVIVNVIMLILNKTNTLDVDIFDIWHLSIVGLFAIFCGANLIIATILVIFIGVLKIINSDLMKPTFNDLLNAPDTNPMTTTHMNYMMNPIIMAVSYTHLRAHETVLDLVCRLLLEKKIFLMIRRPPRSTHCISSAASDVYKRQKLKGRTLNIGLDWPFLAGRAEIWAAANVLAPIMLLEAIVLPGNKLLPLGGIIAMGVTPALLVVTRGKLIRMIIIGAIELPLFLWSGTLIAPFVTETAKKVGAFPAGLNNNTLISHTTMEGPMEKFLGYLVGNASQGQLEFILYACLALVAYLLIFIWYAKQMKKRNIIYAQKAQ